MRIRRIASAAAAMFVAIVVALAVPVSQLRTFSVETSCCCPDPSHCHCPDHKPTHGTQPGMRACHKTSHEVVAPAAPAFAPPEVALATTAPRALVLAATPIAAPHEPPAPARPDAPS